MATNKNRTRNPARQPAAKNQAIQPQPDVVVQHVQVVDVPPPASSGSVVRELPEDPDDAAGLRSGDMNDGEPVFSLNGSVIGEPVTQQLAPYGAPETSYVSSDDPDLDDLTPDERMEQARELRREAQMLLDRIAELEGDDEAPPFAANVAVPVETPFHQPAPVSQFQVEEPVIIAPSQGTRVIRLREDLGPIFYGDTTNPIEMAKGKKYEVPEHIYLYCLERELIWSMA